MRDLIVSTYATLDGRVDDLREWVLPHDHPGIAEYHVDLLADSDGLLLGRRTYQAFAAIWPPRAGHHPYADRINAMTKHVASRTLTDLTWRNSRLIDGEVAAGVAELKRQPGRNLVVYGGRELADTLLAHDLVDEYRVLLHPVLFGRGRGLVADGARRTDLALVDTRVIEPGVVVLSYRPAR